MHIEFSVLDPANFLIDTMPRQLPTATSTFFELVRQFSHAKQGSIQISKVTKNAISLSH
jgi:hypothetical protein